MKKLFNWITTKLKSVFSDLFELIEDKAPLAVMITNKIKEVIEKHDGKIEWLLDQTATPLDNQVYSFIKSKLPGVIKEIAVVDGLVSDNLQDEMAMKIYFEYLASKQKEGRAKEWILIAAKVLMALFAKKVPFDLAVLATQKAYSILFNKN